MHNLDNTLKGHCPDCGHVFHTHAKLEKTTIFSSFSLTRNRIEIASTLEYTIVRYRDIGIVSANECSYLRGAGLLAWRRMSETCPSSTM